MVRVRFAPSPTGPLHLGGVRTALFNYLFARKQKGVFILRIEDTDRTRYIPGAEQYISESLKWCSLDVDEGPEKGGGFGPYRQSERKDIYKKYALELIEKGAAYYAFDTPEELENMRKTYRTSENPSPQYDATLRMKMRNSLTMGESETRALIAAGTPFVIRFKMPENRTVVFHDRIRGEISFHTSTLDDKVLFKSDGMPTYHLANVVDDHLMEISHVIRGEEWLPSTPLHVLLYEAFGWEKSMPEFAHLPLILKPDGKGKLSKRDADKHGFPLFPIEWKDPATGEVSPGYREMGFLPEAFINMLAFLGWNPGDEREIFTLPELIEAFSLDKVSKAGAQFDFEKALWFNQQHIKLKSAKELAQLVKPLLEEKGYDTRNKPLEKICDLLKERATRIDDFVTLGAYIFEAPENYDEKNIKKRWKPEYATAFSTLATALNNIDEFKAPEIEKTIHTLMKEKGWSAGMILPNLRLMLTGSMQGPAVYDIAEIIGKQETIDRIRKGINRFNQLLVQTN